MALSRYSLFIYLFIFSFLGYFGAIKVFIIHLLIHSFIPRLLWSYQCIHYSLIYSIISFLGYCEAIKVFIIHYFIHSFIYSFLGYCGAVKVFVIHSFINSLIHPFKAFNILVCIHVSLIPRLLWSYQ